MNSNPRKSSLVRSGQGSSSFVPDEEKRGCFCFESDDDCSEKTKVKNTKRKLARGCLSNTTICVILIGYTFLGAIIFLAIEGGSVFYALTQMKNMGPTLASVKISNTSSNRLDRLSEESRLNTVENIWEITVSLNILYKENWTRLAAQEIMRFEEMIVKHLTDEMSYIGPTTHEYRRHNNIDWTLAKAFLYSLTVLTTIGYGSLAPKTGLGKAVTMGYAALGIPLVLLYLSSVGSLLSSCARNIFTRSLCCCLCSNCGYCCYDEHRMQEKERRMRKKREKKELEQRMWNAGLQEPFYVTSTLNRPSATINNLLSPMMDDCTKTLPTRSDCFNSESSIVHSKTGNFLAPLLLCLIVMLLYISGGALILCRLETSWSFLDSIFFCFMILSTIGFGDSVPTNSVLYGGKSRFKSQSEVSIWFCSFYIFCGLALTAMCFSVINEEIVHRLKHSIIINGVPDSKTESISSYKLKNSESFIEDSPIGNEYLSVS